LFITKKGKRKVQSIHKSLHKFTKNSKKLTEINKNWNKKKEFYRKCRKNKYDVL